MIVNIPFFNRKTKRERKRAEVNAKLDEHNWVERQFKTALLQRAEEIRAELESTDCFLKPGDEVVVDTYDLNWKLHGRTSRNGWDGGATSVLRLASGKVEGPVKARVGHITVSSSLVDERIDRFFLNKSIEWLLKSGCTEETVWDHFSLWCRRVGETPFALSPEGFYQEAAFELETGTSPQWGVSIYSFLKKGTPEYDATVNLWTRQIELEKRTAELKAEIEAVNADFGRFHNETLASINNLKTN